METAEEGHTLKIFLPHDCLVSNTGVLLGYEDSTNNVICVAGIISDLSDYETISNFIRQKRKQSNIKCIGLWNNRSESTFINGINDNIILQLSRDDADLPVCFINEEYKKLHMISKEMVILFDAKQLFKSQILQENSHKDHLGWKSHRAQPANISSVIQGLCHCTQLCKELNESNPKPLSLINFASAESLHVSFLTRYFTFALLLFKSSIGSITKYRFCQATGQFLMMFFSFMSQIHNKYLQIKKLSGHQKGMHVARAYNIVWRFSMDVILGITVLYIFTQGDHTSTVAKQLMTWADHVAVGLKELLNWMMGVPAGLKLNSQLDQLLGKFFLYHIYLWTGYLQLLRPILSSVLWWIALSGWIGLTVQLSLLQDLISMMTLHIYCFYVYAVRLYSLQVYTLSSLWRLFRGKKWNVLRQRVDSASYDVDQLFMGTLLFTILLFLLPTTALYYVVFMLLRLLVLTIQGFLYKTVAFFNSFPVYTTMLRLCLSSSVTGDVQFQPLPQIHGRPLYLSMKTIHLPISTMYSMFKEELSSKGTQYSWSSFGSKLIFGQLVYPWIDSEHNQK